MTVCYDGFVQGKEQGALFGSWPADSTMRANRSYPVGRPIRIHAQIEMRLTFDDMIAKLELHTLIIR